MATRPLPQQNLRPLHYRGHIVGLDVLRGTAVLAVVLHHAYDNTTHWTHWHGPAEAWIAVTAMGHLGVHLFFVLSGFLITGILLDTKQTRGAARRFYLRRARRILPAYIVALIALRGTHLVDSRYVLASMLFVVNMGRLVGARLTQFSSLWSLAVEEQFYLVWPWILWRCRPKTVRRTIALCFLLPPLFRLGLSLAGQDTYFKTWVNVDYLMYGALIAYTLRSGALNSGNLSNVTRWLYLASGAGMALSVLITVVAGHSSWAPVLFNAIGRTPEMLLFTAMLLSCLVDHQAWAAGELVPGESARAGTAPLARRSSFAAQLWRLPRASLIFLGYISYGLYLVHMIVFRLYDRQVAGTAWGGYEQNFGLLSLRAFLCAALSILIAWLSRITLEEYFLQQKSRRARPVQADQLPALSPAGMGQSPAPAAAGLAVGLPQGAQGGEER